MESVILDMLHFSVQHTRNNIADTLQEILKGYTMPLPNSWPLSTMKVNTMQFTCAHVSIVHA